MLEKIMQQMELELSSPEIQITSPQMTLSLVNNSSREHIDADSPRLELDEVSKDMRGNFAVEVKGRDLHGKTTMTNLEASSSKDVIVDQCKGKQGLQCSEVEQLNERLKFLEEETQAMRQEFSEHLQERKRLVNDIYKMVYTYLQLENQAEEEKTCDGSLTLYPPETGLRPGLSEILCDDWSPCVVTRDITPNKLVLQVSAAAISLHSKNGR